MNYNKAFWISGIAVLVTLFFLSLWVCKKRIDANSVMKAAPFNIFLLVTTWLLPCLSWHQDLQGQLLAECAFTEGIPEHPPLGFHAFPAQN